MKSFLCIVIALMMIVISGCGNKQTPIENDTSFFTETQHEQETNLILQIDGILVDVTWENNETVKALKELSSNGDVVIAVHQYGGFEQVGELPQSLPRNDIQTDTSAGDIVLYNGNRLVIFYGSNSWSYTKLGHINGLSENELVKILAKSNTAVTLSAK